MSFPGIKFQARDFQILRGLFESRVMTLTHVSQLYFEGRYYAAKQRIRKLKAVGVVGEQKRKVYEPSVLFLTRKAFAVLEDAGILTDYPKLSWSFLEKRAQVSERTLRHELEIMDVKAAICGGLRKNETYEVREFSTWPRLYEFKAMPSKQGREIGMQPDGFIRIGEHGAMAGVHRFFLEVDRSTEMLDELIQKALCYVDYYRSGDFAIRNGYPRDFYNKCPFRVLLVCKTEERRNNAAASMAQNSPPILSQVMLTTLAEVKQNPLGPIWIIPFDYREITKGTQFDSEEKPGTWGYKTNPARERFVEQNIQKFALLSDDPVRPNAFVASPLVDHCAESKPVIQQ